MKNKQKIKLPTQLGLYSRIRAVLSDNKDFGSVLLRELEPHAEDILTVDELASLLANKMGDYFIQSGATDDARRSIRTAVDERLIAELVSNNPDAAALVQVIKKQFSKKLDNS